MTMQMFRNLVLTAVATAALASGVNADIAQPKCEEYATGTLPHYVCSATVRPQVQYGNGTYTVQTLHAEFMALRLRAGTGPTTVAVPYSAIKAMYSQGNANVIVLQ